MCAVRVGRYQNRPFPSRQSSAEAEATERPLGARQRDPDARKSFRARHLPLKRRLFEVTSPRGHCASLAALSALTAGSEACGRAITRIALTLRLQSALS
jgi:hypothetical protein